MFIYRYVILWGSPITRLSGPGSQDCSKISRALYWHLGINKLHVIGSTYHPSTNAVASV